MNQKQKEGLSCNTSSNTSSSTASAPSSFSSSIQKYEVLYYKRTNKVHKTKGVSRLDGILTIHPPPSNLVMLHPNDAADHASESDPSDSEEEETSGKLSYNKKMQMMRKKMNTKSKSKSNGGKQALYSAKNADIVKRIVDQGGALGDDDIVVLPAWECQIISAILNSTKSIADQQLSASTTSAASASTGTRTSKLLNRSNKFLGKKRPLASRSLTSSSSSLLKRKAPLQPVTANNRSKTIHARNAPVQRKPPAQPKVNKQQEESDDNDCERTSFSANMTHPSIPASLTYNQKSLTKKKNIITSQRSLKAVPSARSTFQNDACFQGAIGNLHVPSSIKSILRPHQQTGIVFLWNCITGSSPKLQKLIEKSDAGENPDCVSKAGAILADDMGKLCFFCFAFRVELS